MTVTAGNIHDSVAFDDLYEKVTERFPQAKVMVADAAYKTPWICKRIFDNGRVLSTAYKRPMTQKGNLEWYKYVYDAFYDCILCRNIMHCTMLQPTGKAIVNTKVAAIFVQNVLLADAVPRAQSARKQ